MRIVKLYWLSFCLHAVLLYCCGGTLIFAQPAERMDVMPEAANDDYRKHHLYKGRQFVAYLLPVVGSPNHKGWDLLDNSTVVFDGLRYDAVSLMYNTAEDLLIAKHPERETNIVLEKHLVSEFRLEEDTFVHIRNEYSELAAGFYQVIYESDGFVCYAKHSSTVKTYTNGSIMERRFIPAVTFYLDDRGTGDGFYVIKNQRDLLRVDRTERRAVRRLLRSAGLRFRKQPGEAVVAVLSHLDRSH